MQYPFSLILSYFSLTHQFLQTRVKVYRTNPFTKTGLCISCYFTNSIKNMDVIVICIQVILQDRCRNLYFIVWCIHFVCIQKPSLSIAKRGRLWWVKDCTISLKLFISPGDIIHTITNALIQFFFYIACICMWKQKVRRKISKTSKRKHIQTGVELITILFLCRPLFIFITRCEFQWGCVITRMR